MSELTKAELKQLTGTSHVEKQKAVLDQHGIFYITRWDRKSITTTWDHVNNPKGQQKESDEMPNWDKIA